MDTQQNNSLQRTKTFILYTTIALLVIGAAIAIFMIFFGPTHIFGQLLATIFVLYLMTVLSINNLAHTNDPALSARVCSIVALIANLFWALPWILLVWDVFIADPLLTEVVWRFMWTILLLSIYFTVMSTQLPYLKNFSGLNKVKQTIPVALVSYIAINAMVYIWTISWSLYFDGYLEIDIIFKLAAAELILILLQWAIPEIILRSQQGKANAQPTNQSLSAGQVLNNQPRANNEPQPNKAVQRKKIEEN